jgi:hypothetical protein
MYLIPSYISPYGLADENEFPIYNYPYSVFKVNISETYFTHCLIQVSLSTGRKRRTTTKKDC